MMRIAFVALLSATLVVGCKKDTLTQTNSVVGESVIVEGTLLYFSGAVGTPEIHYPPGFLLTSIQWITPTPDAGYRVYVSGVVDSSNVNSHVRVFGTKTLVTLHGTPSSYVYYYLSVAVDSMQIIN